MMPSSEPRNVSILKKNDTDYFQSLSRQLRARSAQVAELTQELMPAEKNVLMAWEARRNAMPDLRSGHWHFERVLEPALLHSWILPAIEEGLSPMACSLLREHIISTGFGEGAPLRVWMLSEKDEVAAACLAFCQQDAWNIFHIRTRKQFRGRGAAAYLLQSVLSAAAIAEAKIVGLTSPGYLIPFHERNGFKVAAFANEVSTRLTPGHTELPS